MYNGKGALLRSRNNTGDWRVQFVSQGRGECWCITQNAQGGRLFQKLG